MLNKRNLTFLFSPFRSNIENIDTNVLKLFLRTNVLNSRTMYLYYNVFIFVYRA